MATKAWVSKQKRREALVKKYADVRRQLKKQKNYAALAKLPRDSSPTRSHLRCQLTGRSRPSPTRPSSVRSRAFGAIVEPRIDSCRQNT